MFYIFNFDILIHHSYNIAAKQKIKVIPADSCKSPQKQGTLGMKVLSDVITEDKGVLENKIHTLNKEIIEVGIRKGHILPLYSIPHFSLTITDFPVRLFSKGFGLTGTVACKKYEPVRK